MAVGQGRRRKVNQKKKKRCGHNLRQENFSRTVLRLLLWRSFFFFWQCGRLLDWDSDGNIQGPKHLINIMVSAAIFGKWVVEGQAFIYKYAMMKFQTKILSSWPKKAVCATYMYMGMG